MPAGSGIGFEGQAALGNVSWAIRRAEQYLPRLVRRLARLEG
jgi:hypothetical protein